METSDIFKTRSSKWQKSQHFFMCLKWLMIFFFLICLEIKVRNQSWIFLSCMNSGKPRSWQWDISLYGISKLIHEEKRVELGYCVWVLSHFSHSTLCDPMDCSPVHGISQARIRQWLPFLSPGELLTQGLSPCLPHCRQILYHQCHLVSPTRILPFCNPKKVLDLSKKYQWMLNVIKETPDSPNKTPSRTTQHYPLKCSISYKI